MDKQQSRWIVTYFSLSTSDGQIAGSNLVAQSSSVNRSAVADKAKSAALRAWTKGSLRDLENAATRTLVRDCEMVRWL